MAEKHYHHNTQTTIVNTGSGGFFSSLFKGVGGAIGCCIGVVIIIGIIMAIASSH